MARKPRGRPYATTPKSAIAAWIPTRDHDRIAQLALKHDVSVSKVVRRLLARALADEGRRPR